jgi:hypothetical protein
VYIGQRAFNPRIKASGQIQDQRSGLSTRSKHQRSTPTLSQTPYTRPPSHYQSAPLEDALKRMVAEFGGKEFTLGRTRVGASNDALRRVLPFLVEHCNLSSVVRCSEACKAWMQELEARGFSRLILHLCARLSGPADVINICETRCMGGAKACRAPWRSRRCVEFREAPGCARQVSTLNPKP